MIKKRPFSVNIHNARVSTTDQDLDIQIARLEARGCESVRSETGSGRSRNGRTELETIMQFLRAGDELVVLRLDRLGRSTRDVLNLAHELEEMGASPRVLEPDATKAWKKDETRRRIAAGKSKASVARELKTSRMTVYRALETVDEKSGI